MNKKKVAIIGICSIAVALAAAFLVHPASAAGTSPQPAAKKESAQPKLSESQSLYQQGMAAAEAGNYDAAYEFFKKADSKDGNNPDILNMLAFSQRKRGNLDEAFSTYEKALNLRPRFPQAREYLGEAHIQAALEQIRLLESYGPEAADELADLVEAFREAASKLP